MGLYIEEAIRSVQARSQHCSGYGLFSIFENSCELASFDFETEFR